MCTKENVTTEQKTLTVFRKSYVRKNDRIRSFFNSFSRRRYAGSLTPIRTWAKSNPVQTGAGNPLCPHLDSTTFIYKLVDGRVGSITFKLYFNYKIQITFLKVFQILL